MTVPRPVDRPAPVEKPRAARRVRADRLPLRSLVWTLPRVPRRRQRPRLRRDPPIRRPGPATRPRTLLDAATTPRRRAPLPLPRVLPPIRRAGRWCRRRGPLRPMSASRSSPRRVPRRPTSVGPPPAPPLPAATIRPLGRARRMSVDPPRLPIRAARTPRRQRPPVLVDRSMAPRVRTPRPRSPIRGPFRALR